MTEVRPATPQLLDLAAEMRPDWPRHELSGALVAANASGWSFARAAASAVRLLGDPEATPRDLLAEVRSPLHHERTDESPEGRELAIAEAMRLAAEAQMARPHAVDGEDG